LRGTQPSWKLRSRFRVSPGIRDAGFGRRRHSHEVSRPHDATDPPRSTTPELFLLGSRCALALTMCLGAFLPRRAPWCPFNQVRPRGRPFRASPVRDMCCLPSSASPLAIGKPTASADTRPAFSAPHEIGRPKGWFLGRTTEGPSLSLQRCFVRFRRIGIAARAASLQGFAPSHRLGSPPPDFSACGTLALLGFILPGVLPFRALASAAAVAPLSRSTTPPHLQDLSRKRARPPLGTSGRPRSEMRSLCSRVSKSCGSWLASSEAAVP